MALSGEGVHPPASSISGYLFHDRTTSGFSAIRHVLYLSSCIFSVSLIVFLLATFLQTTCWRVLDRQVLLTILVSTLTFGFKCPFPQFLRSMRCFLWSFLNYLLTIRLLFYYLISRNFKSRFCTMKR